MRQCTECARAKVIPLPVILFQFQLTLSRKFPHETHQHFRLRCASITPPQKKEEEEEEENTKLISIFSQDGQPPWFGFHGKLKRLALARPQRACTISKLARLVSEPRKVGRLCGTL